MSLADAGWQISHVREILYPAVCPKCGRTDFPNCPEAVCFMDDSDEMDAALTRKETECQE